MAEYQEKFIVLNKKHMNKIPLEEREEFIKSLMKIEKYMPDNNYIVCNQDESYADNVLKIILEGEDAKKASPNNEYKQCGHLRVTTQTKTDCFPYGDDIKVKVCLDCGLTL